MTLGDLYDEIDWSGTESALEEWKSTAMKEMEPSSYSDFSRKWRCTLIAYALPPELTVDPPSGWTLERSQSARVALGAAGVWDQIVEYLIQRGFLSNVNAEVVAKEN